MGTVAPYGKAYYGSTQISAEPSPTFQFCISRRTSQVAA